MSDELVTPEDRAVAVRTRKIILVVLMVIAVVTVSLGLRWHQTGQWTPHWQADRGAVCPVQMMAPAAPADTTINVYNGTSNEGVAADVADSMKRRGYQIAKVGNAGPQNGQEAGTALVVTGPGTVAQALSVQRQVPKSLVVIQPRRSDGRVDLMLTEGFTSLSSNPNLGPGRMQCTQLVFAG
ncbi:LytR C-terminal domain-containing protein [Galactobacter sp.]|uniref:LytR C-terminal domain-containing protein n=1 Tax=Galactobacter sp. TaxID=2676125 RepID=UPI0025BE1016|nr:LytR C-terminal domain-containing protein [Galactobacter sp.]